MNLLPIDPEVVQDATTIGFSVSSCYALQEYCAIARTIADQHGFEEWKGERVPTALALLHSEISEALAEWRRTAPDEVEMPEAFVEELADVAIRLFDIAAAQGVTGARFSEAVLRKMVANKGRPYKHGNKRI